MHRKKPHIAKLPDKAMPDISGQRLDLAIVIPLFRSERSVGGHMWNTNLFQNTFVRGACWAALSIAYNTDYMEHDIPIYFYLDERIAEDAKPVFDAFGVEDENIITFDPPQKERRDPSYVGTRLGSKLAPLLDEEFAVY